MIPEIHIEDFNYPLPDERIAKYPLADRDASKLLVYKGSPVESRFAVIAQLVGGSNDADLVRERIGSIGQRTESGDGHSYPLEPSRS